MTSPARFEDNDETPLLNSGPLNKPTPLPIAQVSILVLPWIAEASASLSLSPYIKQLVRDLPIVGGDERKVGYYTGIVVSLHYAAEGITVFFWNRLSDHIGRKPVLLCCLAGSTVSLVLFGLTRSFLAIVVSRCQHGALRGNMGVVKSAMAELTDESNAAQGFSLLNMAWSVGYIIGPLVGGTLSRPQDRWPHNFSQPFWAKYPYFLPCLVIALYSCMSWVVMAIFLKETMTFTHKSARIYSDTPQEESNDAAHQDTQKPPPLYSLLTRPVLVSISNYAMLTFLEMASLALIPLIWSTSVEFGGLGLSPVSIGLCMSAYGCIDGVFQFIVFPRVVRLFGLGRVFITCVAFCAVVIIMFPLENLLLRHPAGYLTAALWSLIVLQLLSFSILRMGYCAMSMYVSSATPNKRSLGALNGLARIMASVQNAAGPAVADSLFAFSVTNNVLGGNFVYVVLLILVCVGLYIATHLPRHMWRHSGR